MHSPFILLDDPFENGYAMRRHLGIGFSTLDRDNDNKASGHCARDTNEGGWWYDACASSNLNGPYITKMSWKNLRGGNGNIKFTEMKVRPI